MDISTSRYAAAKSILETSFQDDDSCWHACEMLSTLLHDDLTSRAIVATKRIIREIQKRHDYLPPSLDHAKNKRAADGNVFATDKPRRKLADTVSPWVSSFIRYSVQAEIGVRFDDRVGSLCDQEGAAVAFFAASSLFTHRVAKYQRGAARTAKFAAARTAKREKADLWNARLKSNAEYRRLAPATPEAYRDLCDRLGGYSGG